MESSSQQIRFFFFFVFVIRPSIDPRRRPGVSNALQVRFGFLKNSVSESQFPLSYGRKKEEEKRDGWGYVRTSAVVVIVVEDIKAVPSSSFKDYKTISCWSRDKSVSRRTYTYVQWHSNGIIYGAGSNRIRRNGGGIS